MEDSQIPQEIQPAEEQTPASSSGLSNFSNFRESPMKVITVLLVAILAFGLLIGGVFYAASNTSKVSVVNDENESVNFKSVAPYSFVYGYWVGDSTRVNAANLSNGNIYEVASLPYNIKKVTATSPNSLIFINKTDLKDHGSEISTYNTSTGNTQSLVKAADGFGIDDYVVSPNKRYLATWEVVVPEGGQLSQGVSRVYTVDLQNPNVKNLIYNENLIGTTYAHYPIGITDSGEVFYDTFEPNAGIGWANGMSYSNIDGTVKQDLPQVARGTYGTQPRMSSDGKTIVFAGYDGARGPGNDDVDGYRRAVVAMNSIDTLDTATKTRTKIPNLSPENIYDNVEWSPVSNDIFYTVESKNPNDEGQYVYNLNLSFANKLNLPDSKNGQDFVIAPFKNGKFLDATYNQSQAAVANLGQQYSDSITSVNVYDRNSKESTPINLGNQFVQFIGLVPNNDYTTSQVAGSIEEDAKDSGQLQINSFDLKPTIVPVREEQQTKVPTSSSNPKPKTSPTPRPVYGANCPKKEVNKCYTTDFARCRTLGKAPEDCCPTSHPVGDRACLGSPLYLYGNEGQNVSVVVNTATHNSNISGNGKYSGILTGNGGINIGGNIYENIDFDYNSALRRLPRLDYGKTVKASDLNSTIKDFGSKLGLNQKEIDDIIKKVDRENISSRYMFVSFFNDEASKAILPISFKPEPDVYRNIVFYLKPVAEPIVAKLPQFSSFTRSGFTAVEVSYILDK